MRTSALICTSMFVDFATLIWSCLAWKELKNISETLVLLLAAVVTFSRSIGSAFQSSLLAIAGSIVGAALGILTIALVSEISLGFSFMDHPITMVRRLSHLHMCGTAIGRFCLMHALALGGYDSSAS